MNRPCFYCEGDGEEHLSGCPDGMFKQKSDELFAGRSDLEVIATALSDDSRRLDSSYDQAVRKFEQGFDDGSKLERARQPSDHPSYQLGLNRALDERMESPVCANCGVEKIQDGYDICKFCVQEEWKHGSSEWV